MIECDWLEFSNDEKWVARLWNVSEERASEWLVVGVSSLIDFASGLLGRDEKWVARLWNVSEERVVNAQVNFTTTPFNARSSRFQGVPPRKLRFQKG